MWWAVGSMLLWGISGAYASVATRGGTALGAWCGATLIEAVVVLPLLMEAKASFSWSTVVVGVTGGLAYGLFFVALGRPHVPAAAVVAITALYPIVTALIAWLLLGQSLSWRQWFGVATAVVACWLISSN